MTDLPDHSLTLVSLATADARLEISLDRRPIPQPRDHEVLVKVLATPINPSDLGLLVGAADVRTAQKSTRDGLPVITADIPEAGMRAMAGLIGEAMPVGNEGCGIVVRAGAGAEAQALLGKTVALLGGAMYAEYRCLPAAMCMPLPDGTDPADGASCCVNPLTALAFTEVMRREGHSAIVHTAAASNLGQMLVKICAKDGIPLVNIVRSPAQVALLKGIGATHVLDSSAETFVDDLVAALVETGATVGFDAIGGGARRQCTRGNVRARLCSGSSLGQLIGTSTPAGCRARHAACSRCRAKGCRGPPPRGELLGCSAAQCGACGQPALA